MKLGMADYVAEQLSRPNGFFGSRFIGRMMNKSNAELELLALNPDYAIKNLLRLETTAKSNASLYFRISP